MSNLYRVFRISGRIYTQIITLAELLLIGESKPQTRECHGKGKVRF